MPAWPFVHPSLAAIAAALVVIPLIIHYLNRRRHRRVPWAAMMFLRAANQQSASRMTFERWLLLATRMLVLVLLGLAIARPYFPAGALRALSSSRSHRILVIDDSLSMRSEGDKGSTRFDRAKIAAENLLDSFPDGDVVSLVTLSSPAEVMVKNGSIDFRFLRDRISRMSVTQRDTDAVGALRLAQEILENSQAVPGNRFVYLISDFSKSQWESPPGAPLAAAASALKEIADSLTKPEVSLNLVCVNEPAPSNATLSKLELVTPVLGPGIPVRLAAEVINTGASTLRGLSLKVRVTDKLTSGDSLDVRDLVLPSLEPGATTTIEFSVTFASPGVRVLEALVQNDAKSGSIGFDALLDDNSRFLSLEISPSRQVLLVDGRPGATALSGQAGFVTTALAPMTLGAGTTLVTPRVISETDLSDEPLTDCDVVVLCNVARLAAEQWARLAQFVTSGGGLLVFGGDQSQIENYNRHAFTSARGVIPRKLGRAVAGDSESGVSLAVANPHHPIVADFASEPNSGLFSARFDQYLSLVDEQNGGGEVILAFSNGAPAMVMGSLGKGKTALFASSPGMEWTNLPAKGDFVTLMLNTVSYLAPMPGGHRNVDVGSVVVEPLSARESSLVMRVTASDGGVVDNRLTKSGEGLGLEFGPLSNAGVYSVAVGGAVKSVAVNVNPKECELVSVNGGALQASMERSFHWIDDPSVLINKQASVATTELSTTTAYVVLALMMFEAWLALRFGSFRWKSGGLSRGALNPVIAAGRTGVESSESPVRSTA